MSCKSNLWLCAGLAVTCRRVASQTVQCLTAKQAAGLCGFLVCLLSYCFFAVWGVFNFAIVGTKDLAMLLWVGLDADPAARDRPGSTKEACCLKARWSCLRLGIMGLVGTRAMHAHAIYHNVTLPSLYSSRIYSSHIIIRTFVYIYIYSILQVCTNSKRQVYTDTTVAAALAARLARLWDAKQTFPNFWTRGPLPDHASNRKHLCLQSPSLADIIVYSQVYHYLVITLSLLLLQNLFANDNDVQAEVKNCSSWKCPAGFVVPSSKLKLPDPDHATCCEKKLCRGFQCDFASNLLN